ncbi:PTS system, mannose-specific IIC component [Desulfonatronum thiosulfatophilum]|uniref:PTS system, mannose-specific IIC component n=1 Tax=Desulfonatronum thiosulfatophilum TaxID=617002 RepID=A0A1G6DYD1_9BACT|nr:PTS sugar transporter subunit IIC [Desulfonatronum thiosulfatophilum]SDB50122.1 PTS system, mannose-specific IIC component [Desulfonatronum thiosulfatophilum]
MFFFVLFSLARFGLNIGFLDRPLVIGMIWAAVTGHWETALPAAVFFELFFLDLFPIGTYIPPHGPFALLTTLALAHTFDISQPPAIFMLMLLCLPMAFLGSKLEHAHRRRQNVEYTRMLLSTRSGREHSVAMSSLVGKSFFPLCMLNLVVFVLVMALLVPLTDWLLHHVRGRVLVLPITWPMIWMLGTIGALLSLRSRRVYAILLVAVFLAGGIYWVNVM